LARETRTKTNMKLSVALLILSAATTSVSGFVSPLAKQQRNVVRMAADDDDWGGVAVEVKNLSDNVGPNGEVKPRKPAAPQMSQSLPFMECPKVLNGSMAGDVGFDPLGLSKSSLDLTMYREAEIKHARLAMLAAAGWPLSELFDRPIANMMGWTPLLDDANRVPSVLNGGMGKVSPMYWGGVLVLAAAVDAYGVFVASNRKGYTPGDLGFDPFGLYPKDEAGKKDMQLKEIKNGRLAMIAITAYAVHEFIGGTAVVDQTPIFFKPITSVISDYFSSSSGDSSMINDIAPAATSAVESPSAGGGSVDILQYLESQNAPAADAAASIPESITSSVPETVSSSVPDTIAEAPAAVATPPVDIAPAVPAATTISPEDELLAAKQRIAELEGQLQAIKDLSR